MATQIETVNFEDNVEKGKAGIFLTIPGMNAKKKLFGGYEDKTVTFNWIEKTSSRVNLEVSIQGNKYSYKHALRKNIDPSKTEAKIVTTKKVVILLAKEDPQESWSGEDSFLLE